MTNQIFEKNLQCLQKRYPNYAEEVRLKDVGLITTGINRDFVHNWLQKSYSPNKKQAVLLGLANGYAIEQLQNTFAPQFLVIIESDFKNLASAMHNIDMSDALTDESYHWIIGCHPIHIEEGLQYVKSRLAAHGFQVLKTPTANQSEIIYGESILKKIPAIIERETFSLRAFLARGTGTQSNIAINLPVIIDAYPLDAVIQKFQNRPAIITAAGPSLDKNVDQLAGLDNRAVLLCVDTAARTLLPKRIHPHFVVTSDPTPENAKHFNDVILPEKTVFAFAPDACPKAVEKFRDHSRKLCLFDNSNWFNEHYRKLMNLRKLLPRPMHVSELAIRLAIAMGCDPIILVGLDLALPSNSQATHAASSARSARIVSTDNNRIEVEDETGKIISHDMAKVPGIDGNPVLTYYSFKMYLDDLQNIIHTTPKKWIDATEGGALKPGCINQTLQDTLAQLGKSIDIEKCLRIMNKISIELKQNCIESFETSLDMLKELETNMQKSAAGELSLDDATQTWHTFLKDPDIRALLDHAAFPFRLQPHIDKIADNEKMEFLRQRASESINIIKIFIALWDDGLRKCKNRIKQESNS